jgi:2-isopropylmalate synthase
MKRNVIVLLVVGIAIPATPILALVPLSYTLSGKGVIQTTAANLRPSIPLSPLSSSSSSSLDVIDTSTATQLRDDFILKNTEQEVVDSIISSEVTTPLSQPPPAHEVAVGPKHVLIYDTTLRGRFFVYLYTFWKSNVSKMLSTYIRSNMLKNVPVFVVWFLFDVDGTQGESVSASASDKLKITRKLATFDIDYIEAGWPGSNPKDAEFFTRAQIELSNEERAKLVAFGSTRRKNVAIENDTQIQALLNSHAPTICIVAKSHSWQVTEILKADLDENLCMIADSVSYLVNAGRTVMVDLEHFFDGYMLNQTYALQCGMAAVNAGASCLVLCDTNGGTMPWTVGSTCQSVVQHFHGQGVTIGIHCHNDCGMAVANSIMGAQNGVGLIQGTINGIGERTGNADLCSIVPALALHVDTQMSCRQQLRSLTQLSHYVDEILNRTPHSSAPFVGTSAFAHKGGLHVAAMERSPLSYQHIDPELVGNEKRVLISELSGRQNIVGKIQEVGVDMDADVVSDRATAILNHVKQLESKGYTFEGAEASVDLMILHSTVGYCPPFRVLDYSANVYDSHIDSASRVLAQDPVLHAQNRNLYERPATARATVMVRTVGASADDNFRLDDSDSSLPYQDKLEVSDGNGPVDALTKALMRALVPSYPSLASVELADYKVRILDPEAGTKADTRVLIEFRDTETDRTWTTVSVDSNVISASLNALIDGFEFALIDHSQLCILD